MFKTIFAKLIAVFFLILFVCFLVSGLMMYYFLGDFVAQEKERTLSSSIDDVIDSVKTYGSKLNDETVKTFFLFLLQSQSRDKHAVIWVVNQEGYIVYSAEELSLDGNGITKKLLDENGKLRLNDKKQYEPLMKGEVSEIKKVGTFYGIFANEKEKSWLTYAKPIVIKEGLSGEKIIGAVYFSTPVPYVNSARYKVLKLFLIAGGISTIIAILMAYIFSKMITKPLKEMNSAVKVISSGNFMETLNINSKDEVGELARNFNNMLSELRSLEEMRRGFIANVSHELRTPMTSIRGFIEGILDGTIPRHKHDDYLKIVKDETVRLNKLVNDLLDLAKIEAGEFKISYTHFDINELIRRCIIKFEKAILEKNINIEANFETEYIYVYADQDSIERVIINLFHNAIKFSKENGEIILKTSIVKSRITVSIKDNGIGIPENDLQYIWERFFKGDKSRSSFKKGTGLGLPIVKNIMNEHKEDITVVSKENEGTEFRFTLKKSNGENK